MTKTTNSKVQSLIAARYNNDVLTTKRKNISFNIDEELLERLDSAVNVFNEKDTTTTRNAIIEDAILAYIEEAEDYFEKQNLINDETISFIKDVTYDTAIFPAKNINFNSVFIGKHQWYHVRMAQHRIENIKYIALYRGAPASSITHYAEVIEIGNPDENNRRIIHLKEPELLPQPVQLGDVHVNNVRKLFYTTLEKLKSVDNVNDLINQ